MVNKVIVAGRLTHDPELRQAGGSSVANFTLALNERWTDKSGEKKERTTFVRIVAWGKLADLCGDFLRKGREALVDGKIQVRDYTTKEGEKRQAFEIVANEVKFLGGGKDQGEGRQARPAAEPSGPPEGWEDDIAPPF